MNEISRNLNFNKLIFRGSVYNKNEIESGIEYLANYLKKSIISSSPFIILTTYNHIKTVIAYYAILRIGKIAVILDPATKTLELTEMIADTEPSAIILINSNSLKWEFSEEIIFRDSSKRIIIESNLKDVCTIAYTNAEDGYSKGAMLTEDNLLAEIKALVETNKLTKNAVTYALLPFSHMFGLVQGILVPTHAGCTGVIADLDITKINEILDSINRYKVSHIYSVPSIYYMLCKVININNNITSVEEFYSGGAKLSPFIFERFYNKTKRKIREGYGLTESSPGVLLNYEEEPIVESIGKPMPGCKIKIFNDIGEECSEGEVGEICIKGDTVFKGYFNNEKATQSVLKDDWLYTGDYGKLDKNGYVYFCGLKKNMINVAGNNVYPSKVIRLMRKNENVEKVAIQAKDSLVQGQISVAQIKLFDSSKKAQEDFKDWCLKNISNVILPKVWEFE